MLSGHSAISEEGRLVCMYLCLCVYIYMQAFESVCVYVCMLQMFSECYQGILRYLKKGAWYVCVCVCIYACMCIYMQALECVSVCVYAQNVFGMLSRHTSVSGEGRLACMYECVCVPMRVYASILLYMCVYIYIRMLVQLHTCM